MGTVKTVGDGREKGYCLTNENLGLFVRRMDEIKKRIQQTGSKYDIVFVEKELQKIIEAIGLFDPNESFDFQDNKKGLGMSEDFNKYILSVAKRIKYLTIPDCISGCNLSGDRINEKIFKNFSEDDIFSASEICFVITEMANRQPEGECGDLLLGGENIYRVRGKNRDIFAVCMHWRTDVRGWFVGALRPPNNIYWKSMHREFSRKSILGK